MAKFNVFRKGGQVSATVYASATHRSHILNTVGNVSPFYEEVSENGEATHMIVYQPVKVELEGIHPDKIAHEVFDSATLESAGIPRGKTVRVFPPQS